MATVEYSKGLLEAIAREESAEARGSGDGFVHDQAENQESYSDEYADQENYYLDSEDSAEDLGQEQEQEIEDGADDASGSDDEDEEGEKQELVSNKSAQHQKNGLVKHLRNINKQKEKKILELSKKIKELEPVADTVKKQKIENKPVFGDYLDEDEYSEALAEWIEAKKTYDHEQKIKAKTQEAQEKEIKDLIDKYTKSVESVKSSDYEAAEYIVKEMLTPAQRELILYSDNPAKIVLALHKYPHKLEELSAIRNYYKFSLALNDFESKIKQKSTVDVNANKKKPETQISGARTSKGGEKANLERLLKIAERTGDYTDYIRAEKKSLR